jgi:glucosamine--fructose-6-phosphate aminotransferase (isomerizing)
MTHFLEDILRQPSELQRALDYLSGSGWPTLAAAAAAVRGARNVYLTGIGASWHAALNAGSLLHLGGRPVYLLDAAELLHFTAIPSDAVIVILSRSGRSVEIVRLLAKARDSRTTVIGLTNSAHGPLARESQIPLVVPATLDHGISVNTYSTLALAGGALAGATLGSFDSRFATSLSKVVADAARAIGRWQQQIEEDSTWLVAATSPYFLARGSSLGSCYEARLLWEEGVKAPATSIGTGAFRHGPQEIAVKGSRFGMWIDRKRMREEALAVARDLRRLADSVMLIGQRLPEDVGDLVFQLPPVPPEWQFLIDIFPAQLAAERLSRLSRVDCDVFRVCSYVVEGEYGLLPIEAAPRNDEA